jgi:hypothetical protein
MTGVNIVSASSPSIADWLQAWGTVAGAFFAALAAFVAVAVLHHDRRASRASEAEQAAGQARSVLVDVNAQWEKDAIDEVEFSIKN